MPPNCHGSKQRVLAAKSTWCEPRLPVRRYAALAVKFFRFQQPRKCNKRRRRKGALGVMLGSPRIKRHVRNARRKPPRKRCKLNPRQLNQLQKFGVKLFLRRQSVFRWSLESVSISFSSRAPSFLILYFYLGVVCFIACLIVRFAKFSIALVVVLVLSYEAIGAIRYGYGLSQGMRNFGFLTQMMLFGPIAFIAAFSEGSGGSSGSRWGGGSSCGGGCGGGGCGGCGG